MALQITVRKVLHCYEEAVIIIVPAEGLDKVFFVLDKVSMSHKESKGKLVVMLYLPWSERTKQSLPVPCCN